MKATVITHTPDPEKDISAATKPCYSSSEVGNRFEKNLDGSVDGLLKYHNAVAGTDETNE